VAIRVPGSKSITNRALVLAALNAERECILTGGLWSEDTEVMVDGLNRLGFAVGEDWVHSLLQVKRPRTDRLIPAEEADLFVANSGTTMRFLTALTSLGHGRYRLDGSERMRQRPIGDLLAALQQLGVCALSEAPNGCPPVVVGATGLHGGTVRIRGDVSSQFLSGLLLAAPCSEGEITIEVEGPLVSQPYVTMTLEMMKQWRLRVLGELPKLVIPGGQRPRRSVYVIEPDASAAGYFAAAAAITAGTITLVGITARSLQGDFRLLELLETMGCRVERGSDRSIVTGGPLHGIDADMNDISDMVMTLAVVACFADGPTAIRNVAHIRHKETDRLSALATELRRLGAGVDESADGLRIIPGPLHGAVCETYNDHRMAMSLALAGLRVAGVVIENPGCVAKTYPRFFEDLERLRAEV
jgi:3-phosphoshikimate 1-carboxyvinyltransferase